MITPWQQSTRRFESHNSITWTQITAASGAVREVVSFEWTADLVVAL